MGKFISKFNKIFNYIKKKQYRNRRSKQIYKELFTYDPDDISEIPEFYSNDSIK